MMPTHERVNNITMFPGVTVGYLSSRADWSNGRGDLLLTRLRPDKFTKPGYVPPAGSATQSPPLEIRAFDLNPWDPPDIANSPLHSLPVLYEPLQTTYTPPLGSNLNSPADDRFLARLSLNPLYEPRRASYPIIGAGYGFPLVAGRLHTIVGDICVLDGNTCQPKPTPVTPGSAPATAPVYAILQPEAGDDPWLDLSATWWGTLTLEEQSALTGDATGKDIPHPKGFLSSLKDGDHPDQLRKRVVWTLTQPANRPDLLQAQAATIETTFFQENKPFRHVVPHARLKIANPGLHEVELAVEGDDGERLVVDKARFVVFMADLDIDSDNDDAFHVDFERNPEEDALEDDPVQPGKILVVNTGDQDGDGIPNFADGLLTGHFDTRSTPAGGPLTPVVLELLPEGVDWTHAQVKFHYDASSPEAMAVDDHGTPDNPADDTYTLPGSGHLRLWTKNGNTVRQAATDYLEPDTAYQVSALPIEAGHEIRLYLEGVKASPTEADLRQLRVDIDPTGSGDFVEDVDAVRVTVVAVTDMTIYRPESADFTEPLEWGEVIFRDEPVRVAVTLSAVIPSVHVLPDGLLALRVFSDAAEHTWIPLTLNQQNTATLEQVNGASQIRLTLTWDNLLALKMVQPVSDGLREFTSADSATEPDQQSHLDGNTFATLMAGKGNAERGKARRYPDVNGKMVNGNIDKLESPMNKDFAKAAGVQFIQLRAPNGSRTPQGTYITMSEPRQVQNQAEYFYYSGHGQYYNPKIDSSALSSIATFTPLDAASSWQQELRTAIFMACSVLDIHDYTGNWILELATDGNPANDNWGDKSPGMQWITHACKPLNGRCQGPNLFLGYLFRAPSDISTNRLFQKNERVTADIVQRWFDYQKQGTDAGIAWMKAVREMTDADGNPHFRRGNAAVIDLGTTPWKYYYFIESKENTGNSRSKQQSLKIHTICYEQAQGGWPLPRFKLTQDSLEMSKQTIVLTTGILLDNVNNILNGIEVLENQVFSNEQDFRQAIYATIGEVPTLYLAPILKYAIEPPQQPGCAQVE